MRAPNESAAAREFHREWNGGAPIVEEAEKHRFTEAFVSRVLVPKDPRWGRKSRAGGEGPLSKDTIGYWLGAAIPTEPTDGQLDARDLLTSSGADSWNSDDDPAYNNIHARWYPVAPSAGASAGATVAASAQPTAPDSPPLDSLFADLERRLLEHVDAAVQHALEDVRSTLDRLPDTIAAAVNERVDKRLVDLQANVDSRLAALPKEYELHSLGRVIGTMTPKQ